MIKTIHTKKLYTISLVCLCERYAFYAMRSILILYLMRHLQPEAGKNAYAVFASFASLLYVTPVLGGSLADRFVGKKNAILIGGIILSCGYMLLALNAKHHLYLALSAISVGSGLFMPNIASEVSSLCRDKDSRQESAFSIFYTAINIGAFMPPIVSAILLIYYDWSAVFLMCTLSVLISTLLYFYLFGANKIKTAGHLIKVFMAFIIATTLIAVLIKHPYFTDLFLTCVSLPLMYFLVTQLRSYEITEKRQLVGCLLLIILSIVFATLYQQGVMSLTVFTQYNVSRSWFDYHLPTVGFQSLNPLFIMILGPVFAKLLLQK